MSKKRKIIITSGILILMSVLYTWGLPVTVNTCLDKTLLEKKIFENSGYRVSLGNPKLTPSVFPFVNVKSEEITLLNPDDTKAVLIVNPQITLNMIPLLRKKTVITRFHSDREEIYFTLTKDSKFMIGSYPLEFSNKDKKSEFTLTKMNLTLGEYKIFLKDEKNSKNAVLSGEYFNHGKYVSNKQAKFATKGTFNIAGNITDFNTAVEIKLPINRFAEDKLQIRGDIRDFDISSISDYVKIITENKITSLKGLISINADTQNHKKAHKKVSINIITKDLEINGKDRASSIIYPGKLAAAINFSTINNGILFENTSLEAKKIHAFVEGKISELGSKAPKYDITAEVKDTRTEDVVKILPGSETLLPDFNLYKLKQYVFYADGAGKVRFKGRGNRPNVTGKVQLRNAYLLHPLKGAPANASIDMKFLGQKMLLDVFVPTGKDQNVTVKGNILIDGSKYSELEVKSTDAVNLAPAQEILNPLHEILKFQLGPVPLMQISGLGTIDMRSAGKKVDPHMWGEIKFRNGIASFNEINNLELKNASGEVIFDDTFVTFKSYNATINGRPVEIKGDCAVLGKINVYVTSKGQDVKKLVKTIETSPLLIDVQKVVKPFTNPDGIADVFLHIYGTAKNAEEVVFNEDLFSRGTITLHGAKTILQDTFLPFTNINGTVNFDKYDSDYDVTGYVRKSPVHVIGTGSNSEIDLKAYSDKFRLSDIFDMLHPDMEMPYKNELGRLYTSFTAGYKGIADADNIDYDKIKVNGKFLSNMSTTEPIRIDGGTFTIDKGFLKTSPLKGLFNNNPFTLTFTAKDLDKEIFSITDAVFNFKDFDISAVNVIKNQVKLPKELAKEIDNITDIRGVTDITGYIKNNEIVANTDLKNTSFVYKPFGAVVRILNGNANMRGETLYLDKINSRVSSMPVFLNGKINGVYDENPNLDISLSAKLTQTFFDRFFNSKSVYPVKAKGEINFHTKLRGPLNALNARSNLNLGENSSLYYMGATLAGAPTGTYGEEGFNTNPVSIVSNIVLYPDKIKINTLDYNQIITSQNKKKSVQKQLGVSGEVSLLNNNVLGFKNFKVKTENPTNARIFNVLFKKPTIKQGVFTSDLTINGTSEAPYVLGYFNVKSVDIPLLDAIVRDINIDFKDTLVSMNAKAVVMTNDILMNAKIINKPTLPVVVEDMEIQTDKLDLNVVTEALNAFEADNTRANRIKQDSVPMLPPNTLIVKNARVNADNIIIKKAGASDFKSKITLDKDQILKVENYGFNIANGTVNGNIEYDLKNYKGKAAMSIDNADAQIIAENFFDMPGQMYGTVTGDMNIACSGLTSVECLNSLAGDGKFEVTDGRMPKLGSLEYLLKAGNLITGGVTGISINGIIDLITPLKTGNFKSINGTVHVKDGIADDINVYSSGKDLNLYMTGSYNISTLVADMEVYGSLSKNISSILGKIANSSLNTLFNTIPGININEINPKSTSNIHKIPNFDKTNTLRVFKSEIYGDINGSNYVKSFRWIKD